MMREREKEDMQRDLTGFHGEITAVKQQLITLQRHMKTLRGSGWRQRCS
jgi:hypothetical protein